MDWFDGFLVPLIKTIFAGFVLLAMAFFSIWAFRNGWNNSLRFYVKYKLFKKRYPKGSAEWCMDCIEKGIGYYDAKKLLYISMKDYKDVNETLYIYDQLVNELNKEKGGSKNNERKIAGSHTKAQRKPSFPTLKTSAGIKSE